MIKTHIIITENGEEYPQQTFNNRAISCTGKKDAKVIGINTYQEEIYVSW